MSLEPLLNRRQVIGMYPGNPVVEVIADFVILESEEFLQKRIDVDFTGDEIPIPEGDSTGRGGAPVAIVSVHGAHG
jgi:hypothetical protein